VREAKMKVRIKSEIKMKLAVEGKGRGVRGWCGLGRKGGREGGREGQAGRCIDWEEMWW
jgi:hypothetical protein